MRAREVGKAGRLVVSAGTYQIEGISGEKRCISPDQ